MPIERSDYAVELNHGLDSLDLLVYIVGRQYPEGPVHQYFLGGIRYRDSGLYVHEGLQWSWDENTVWIGRGDQDYDYELFRVYIWRIPEIS